MTVTQLNQNPLDFKIWQQDSELLLHQYLLPSHQTSPLQALMLLSLHSFNTVAIANVITEYSQVVMVFTPMDNSVTTANLL
jgi:hypothetical protein